MGPTSITVGGGRTLAYDDVGDPDGRAVVYLHGTPDCRLARHPDDTLAVRAGVRLLAVDRPGYGESTYDPDATVGSVAHDVGALADALGVERFGVLAWSGGAPYGLACASVYGGRVTAVAVACGLPPVGGRPDLVDVLADVSAAALAKASVEWVAPDAARLTVDGARRHLAETSDPVRAAEVASIPGAEDQLARSLVEALQAGTDGLRRDLEVLTSPPDVDVSDVRCPVRLLYGDQDSLAPPAYGEWLAARLPASHLEVVPGASHALALTHWASLLGWLAPTLKSDGRFS